MSDFEELLADPVGWIDRLRALRARRVEELLFGGSVDDEEDDGGSE